MPDEITVKLWKARIDAAVDAHTFKPDIDLLVLDGIPRNVAQAEIMDELIDVKKVFHLSCPESRLAFRAPEKTRIKRQSTGRRKRRSDQAPARDLRGRVKAGPRLLWERSHHLH